MKLPRLCTDDAEGAWIAMPPPGGQERIVAKVEELPRGCDELEAPLTAARTTGAHLLDATFHQLLAA